MRIASWASIAAVSTLVAGSAAAMPTPAPYHADLGVTLAAGGCGYAYHRNVYGACVPNGYGWGGGVVVAPGLYGAPGWHGGYYGGAGWHGGYYQRRLLSRRWLAWRGMARRGMARRGRSLARRRRALARRLPPIVHRCGHRREPEIRAHVLIPSRLFEAAAGHRAPRLPTGAIGCSTESFARQAILCAQR